MDVRWLIVGVLVIAAPTAAQTIYKCETAQGPVYSQMPCARTGAHETKMELKPDHPPHADDVARAAKAERDSDERLRQADRERAVTACVNNQTASARAGANRRIPHLQSQIEVAEYSMGFSANNTAGAIRSQGLQQRVASLRAAIDNERRIVSEAEQTARTVCAAQFAASDSYQQAPAHDTSSQSTDH